MDIRKYGPYCLVGQAGFPPGSVPVPSFTAPLVILKQADPHWNRCLYPIHSLAEVEQESTLALLPPVSAVESPLEAFVRENGAAVLNTAFPDCWRLLELQQKSKLCGLRVTLVGLGDVGGAVLTGLILLGKEIEQISIYDPNQTVCQRYAFEMNQILPVDGRQPPHVRVCPLDALFDCDLFLFAASRGVPPLGSAGDVRMAQYQANRSLAAHYAKLARKAGFSGLFCQISDPVDHLCRAVFLESNRSDDGKLDFLGLLPEQIQGFGLGVMAARAAYCADELGLPRENLRVYGPHGTGLIAANAPLTEYDDVLSRMLSEQTRDMNLRIRDLGFKPYLAPALSSAVLSILQLVRGQSHYGAVPLGGVYFGCKSRMTRYGIQPQQEPLAPILQTRIQTAFQALQEFAYES